MFGKNGVVRHFADNFQEGLHNDVAADVRNEVNEKLWLPVENIINSTWQNSIKTVSLRALRESFD